MLGMFIHVYSYQKYDKQTELNDFYLAFLNVFKLLFINDFISTLAKFRSLRKTTAQLFTLVDLVFPALQFIILFRYFGNFEILGYEKSFLLYKLIFYTISAIKTMFTLAGLKFISEILRVIDAIWWTNIVLVVLTDPLTNTDEYPNAVTFYEIFFRYMEFFTLILACVLIYNSKNISDDISYSENCRTIHTIASVLGEHDSYVFTSVLLLSHYFFVFINGIAYSINYWIGLSSLFLTFMIVSSYRQKKMTKVYLLTLILLVWNLSTYLHALIKSAPNVGNLQYTLNNYNSTLLNVN